MSVAYDWRAKTIQRKQRKEVSERESTEGRERDMTDILIAFTLGVFVGASLLVIMSCLIVGRDYDENMPTE